MNYDKYKKCTDLEIIDLFCEECIDFIDPAIFREIRKRGLYSIINKLHSDNVAERKALARAKLKVTGVYVGDPEIEQIASIVESIKSLQQQVYQTSPTEAIELLQLSQTLQDHCETLKNYYRSNQSIL